MAIVAGQELGQNVVTGTFVATGSSAARRSPTDFSYSVWGTFVATLIPQRSFDNGVTWNAVSADTSGTAASWTVPVDVDVRVTGEIGVLYRLNCSAYTSGTVNYRISR